MISSRYFGLDDVDEIDDVDDDFISATGDVEVDDEEEDDDETTSISDESMLLLFLSSDGLGEVERRFCWVRVVLVVISVVVDVDEDVPFDNV